MYEDDALILKQSINNKGIFAIHVQLSASDIAHPLEDVAKGLTLLC